MICGKCRRDLAEDFFSPGMRTGSPARRVCRACHNERIKAYQAAHRGKIREYGRRYEREHTPERNAKSSVKRAIRDGRMRVMPCAVCGTVRDVEAHHFSYEPRHWLSVYWLCTVHHKAAHAGTLDLAGLRLTIGRVKNSRLVLRDMAAHPGDPAAASL